MKVQMNSKETNRRFVILAALASILILFGAKPAAAQDWFKTGTGLGVSKVRVAAPDFAVRGATSPALEKTFHDVLWNDLEYSGILELVSASFYPSKIPSQQSELNAPDWANAPANTNMLAYGNLSLEGSNLLAAGFLSDVHNPTAPIALQKIYRGASSDADARRLAFTCFVPYRGITSPQICLFSTASDRMISFPRFPGTNSSPAWSPDGAQLAFMSSQNGDPEIYVCDSDGSHLQRLTFAAGVSTSPVWNPKTGKQIVFVSDRAGDPVLYLANSDGTNVQRLDMPDMGYVVDPSWSPNGQLLAFSWRRPSGNFDIYVMDIVSRQLVELTRDEGRNERPSWAPDGRHLVFESTRTGKREIWSMLADGSRPRQLTYEGLSESPSWSSR